MSKNPNFKSDDDGDEDDNDDIDDDDDDGWWRKITKVLLREATHQAYGKSSLWRGGRGGALSPGRSRIRGPTRPFASQNKIQSSPLGNYLFVIIP